MPEIKKIIDSIKKASDQFGGSLSSTEKNLFDEVVKMTKELKVNSSGNIITSTENLKLVNSIRKNLDRIVLNKSYLGDVKELIKSFDGISQVQMNYFSTLTTKKITEAKYKEVQRIAINNTVDMLAGAGVQANVTGPINEMLLNSVTSGMKYTDLTDNINNLLTKTPSGDGALTKYARTYSTTALNQFAGQNNKLLTDDLKIEWFMYVGSNITTTREFCYHLTKKKLVHVSEIPTILTGDIDGHQCKIYDKTDLPYGLIEGTNAENFQVYCGGWNCGHKLVPVSKESVPMNIRARFETIDINHSKTFFNEIKQSEVGTISTDRFGDVVINKRALEKTQNINRGDYKNQIDALNEVKNLTTHLNSYKGNIEIHDINNPSKAIKKKNIEGYVEFTTKDNQYLISLEVDKSMKGKYKLYYIKKVANH